MKRFDLKKTSPFQICVLISLGLHLFLLLTPLDLKRNSRPEEIEAVRLTPLPIPTKSSASSTAMPQSPMPSPLASPQTARPQVPSPQPAPTPIARISRPQPPQVLSPAPVQNIAPGIPNTVSSPVPDATPQILPFADFPQYPNAQPGSCESGEQNSASQRTQDSPQQVAQYFERELPIRGYGIQPEPGNPQVYQVVRGGMRQYLNLLPCEGGTAIVLSDRPLADLQNTQLAEQAETALGSVLEQLNQLGAERIDVPEFYFPQPELFFERSPQDSSSFDPQRPLDGFDGNFVVILDQSPEDLFLTFFSERLSSSGFTATQLPDYGSGLLYEIRQGEFVRYLNLIQTQDGTGTLVVLWSRLPQ